jgi:hypothetical protein
MPGAVAAILARYYPWRPTESAAGFGDSMTSEADSKPRRRPPTIDLTATEIRTESSGASQSAATAHAGDGSDEKAEPERHRDGNFAGTLRAHALGAAMGAVLVAGLAFGLWAFGFVPARNAPPTPSDSGTRAISSQLAKIEAELQTHPAETALAARVANVEAQTKALGDSLAAINRRLDEIAAAVQGARQRADAADQAAQDAAQKANAAANSVQGIAQKTAQNSVQPKDLDALAARVAALENSITALSDTAASTAHRAANANDRAARAAVAAEALRATVERGTPYQSELATVKSFGADQNDVTALEPFAANGVPTAAALARTFSQLIPSLAEASSPKTSDGTLLGRLEDHAKTLVRITPIGAPAGDDPTAIIARLNVDAAHADIVAALADIDRLPPAAKSLAQSWVQKAKASAAAIAASRRIAAATLTGLSSTHTQ